MEELNLKPDQLVTYYLWADDLGPDGQVRRTASDIYFAEVRPFDEIYREDQSGQGQDQGSYQNQPGNASEETARLVELQKQIINATWKLQRQANRAGRQPSAQYLKDAPVVLESQKTALDQARSMKARAPDAEASKLIEQVEREMEQAVVHLTAATKTAEPLPQALAVEQSAYQALLKLRPMNTKSPAAAAAAKLRPATAASATGSNWTNSTSSSPKTVTKPPAKPPRPKARNSANSSRSSTGSRNWPSASMISRSGSRNSRPPSSKPSPKRNKPKSGASSNASARSNSSSSPMSTKCATG